MSDHEQLLKRWQAAGLLDEATARRIRAFEQGQEKPSRQRWLVLLALVLGAMLMASSVVLFVSAHWDELGPWGRFALTLAMVAVFHLGGGLTRPSFRGLSTALHAVGTVATGAGIALVGQIFNLQEHWPGAVLLWAVAAAAGWMLLGDEAQQMLTLLLAPSWILSELIDRFDDGFGANVYAGRFLLVWGALYLVFFVGSPRRIVQGVLFAAGALTCATGFAMLQVGWLTGGAGEQLPGWGVRIGAWVGIAVIPLAIAALRLRRSLLPVAAALACSIALPWCVRSTTIQYAYGSYTKEWPNLLAYLLVGGYAVLIGWWGVRQASRALLNLGIVGFGVVVVWFYWSNLMDKIGRSLGLMGLGVLFLAGGWALERMRRKLTAQMGQPASAQGGEVAQ